MKPSKRILTTCLIFSVTLGLVGCGKPSSTNSPNSHLAIPYFSNGNPIGSTVTFANVEKDLEISADQLSIVRKDNQFKINVNLGLDPESETAPVRLRPIESGEDFTFNSDQGLLSFESNDKRLIATNSAYWFNKQINQVLANGYLKSLPMDMTVYGQCEDMLNAYFNPENNIICIGHQYKTLGRDALNGMASLGFDADVMAHEMGHGILHHIMNNNENAYVSFGSDMFSAMNEGQADFYSFITTGSEELGPWFMEIMKETYLKLYPEYYDTIKDQKSLRPIANNFKMGENFFGEIHDDGSIWAGTLLDVAKKIGKQKALSLWLYATSKLAETNNYFDDASLMLEADSKLFNGENTEVLKAIFRNRGIFDTAQLKSEDLKFTYTIDDDSDHVKTTLKVLGLEDSQIDPIVKENNKNGQLDTGECAMIELKFTNTSDKKLTGLEFFISNNLMPEGLRNEGLSRLYFGYLNPEQSSSNKVNLNNKNRPWLLVCADQTYTSGGVLSILLKNLSEEGITFNVQL